MIEVNYNEYKETIADNMKLIQENHKLKETIKEAINYIKKESWFCYKDNEEIIDRTPVNKLLEILENSNG